MPETLRCLAHSGEDERRDFLVHSSVRQLSNCLRNLEISASLHVELLPYFGRAEPLVFRNCTYPDSVDFTDAKFGGPVYFESVTFRKRAIFGRQREEQPGYLSMGLKSSPDGNGATFSSDVGFSGTEFEEGASFSYARFLGNVYFKGVTFKKQSDFEHTFFEGSVSFGSLDQGGTNGRPADGNSLRTSFANVRFYGTHFSRAAYFSSVTFGGHVGFNLARFGSEVEFSSCLHEQEPGSGGTKEIGFFGAEFSEDIHIGCSGSLSNLSKAHFENPLRISVDGDIALNDIVLRSTVSVGGRSIHSYVDRSLLVSLAGANLQESLIIEENISMVRCSLDRAAGLDRLKFNTTDPGWPIFRHRRSIADERRLRTARRSSRSRARGFLEPSARPSTPAEPEVPAKRLETAYRQLRTALEASHASPDAADFYYGEMEMRRLGTSHWRFERMLLNLYKLTSGYGLRARRALLTYLAILMGAAVLVRYRTATFVYDQNSVAGATSPGARALRFDHYWEVVAILSRSAVNFLSGVSNGLSAWGVFLILLLRLTAPAFLALAIFAVRARVQR